LITQGTDDDDDDDDDDDAEKRGMHSVAAIVG
jgi:hypothetical protein